MNWLLDTDVICQPAKRLEDARVIAWLHQERDQCFTSAIVIAQLAYWKNKGLVTTRLCFRTI